MPRGANDPKMNVEKGAKGGLIALLASIAGIAAGAAFADKNPDSPISGGQITAATTMFVAGVLSGICNWWKHRWS